MNKRKQIRPCMLAVAVGAMVAALSGCQSNPKHDARLDAATAQYSNLRATIADPSLASAELKEAKDALGAAQKAFDDHADTATVDHKIYLAQRKVAIAEQIYRRKVADVSLAQLKEQRGDLQLQARAAELDRAKSELQALKAQQSQRGMVMTLGDVMFDTGKYQLKSGGHRQVQKLAEFLRENPERKVRIEGFTDSVGADEYNQQLSQRRADAVKAELIAAGIEPERIATEGYGEAFPVASNDNSSGRQMNRRVEVVIASGGESIPGR